MTISELTQYEDLIRWATEFVDDRMIAFQLLWYPKYQPMSNAALYAFSRDIN
jgi:hypothetical protein